MRVVTHANVLGAVKRPGGSSPASCNCVPQEVLSSAGRARGRAPRLPYSLGSGRVISWGGGGRRRVRLQEALRVRGFRAPRRSLLTTAPCLRRGAGTDLGPASADRARGALTSSRLPWGGSFAFLTVVRKT